MLTKRVIPCLDVRDGRIVKGVQFSDLRDAGDPATRAAAYQRQGADEIVILDVSATLEARQAALETVRAVRRVLSIPLTVGGGLRTCADAEQLLAAGADKVAVNTAAVDRPAILTELAEAFGVQCTVLAIDAARVADGAAQWEVVTHAGQTRTGRSAPDWASEGVDRGAGEILLTSWDRDGSRSGYDLMLIDAVARRVSVPIIASGGAASADHMVAALQCGADAVLAASVFHDGEFTVGDIKQTLADAGTAVRR